MTVILAFLATGLGKWIVGACAVILALIGSYVKGRFAGSKAEKAKQAASQLDAIKSRKETDDEVNSLAPADVDTRLSKWLSDGKR